MIHDCFLGPSRWPEKHLENMNIVAPHKSEEKRIVEQTFKEKAMMNKRRDDWF